MIKIRTIVGLFAAAAISTAATGQMSLDLNPSSGDQGEREKMVKPGESFAVELIAIGGATGQIGFTVELKFDTNQVHFKGFNAGGLMAGAMSMPPKPGPSSIVVYAAIMGGSGATEDAGSLGQVLFEADPSLTRTSVEIVSASFGSAAGPKSVDAGPGVMIVNPDAPVMPPQDSGQHGFQAPPGDGTGMPPGDGRGMPPGDGRGMPPGDGRGMPPGDGRGMPPGGGPGTMGGQPRGGGMGDDRGHQGGPGSMDPHDMIAKLPAALRPAFEQTMEVERTSERARIEAELAMARSIRGTLEQTKQFLAGASREDQETVLQTLWLFHSQDRDDRDPMGGPGGRGGGPPGRMDQRGGMQGGGPGMGRPGQGGPGMGHGGQGMPDDASEMVRRMIEEVEREIQHLEQELQHR